MGSIVITVVTALFVNDTGCHFLCEGVTLNVEKLQHLVAPSQKTMKLFMMNPRPWMQLIPHILTDSSSGQAVTFFHY